MGIKDFFKRFKSKSAEAGEEYVEIEHQQKPALSKVTVQIEKLDDFADSDRIQRKIREGVILFVRVRGLKDKNMEDLKRAIARIKKTCLAVNGDIAGISDDWIVVTPSNAQVYREIPEGVETGQEVD